MSAATESNQHPDRQSPRFWVKSRARRAATISLLLLVILMTAAFFGLRWFEMAVTFHPERYAAGPAWELPRNAEDVWMKTADGVRLHGWFIKAGATPAAATVIYFHGNGGNLSHVGWVGQGLAARGFDVLLFDYRGYGRSDGNVSDERALNADADAAYDYVAVERGVSPDRLALYGASLGTTTAVDLASRKPCGALVLESGLSSASDLATVLLPFVPRWAHRFGRNRFESARKLEGIHCPVLITHGEPDDRIPTEQGRKLFASANQPKRLLILPGAGHNVIGFGGQNYIATVAAFISNALHKP
ncbi:MAG: uncharacterized protein V7641_3521, partial [Blastocatellia bacterium]